MITDFDLFSSVLKLIEAKVPEATKPLTDEYELCVAIKKRLCATPESSKEKELRLNYERLVAEGKVRRLKVQRKSKSD